LCHATDSRLLLLHFPAAAFVNSCCQPANVARRLLARRESQKSLCGLFSKIDFDSIDLASWIGEDSAVWGRDVRP
jgi:hypothetical protein